MAMIDPKRMNIFRFAYEITGISFSYDSKFLAISSGEVLVVLEANEELSIFEPIGFDKAGGFISLDYSGPHLTIFITSDKVNL
jgi:hypothetical protein